MFWDNWISDVKTYQLDKDWIEGWYKEYSFDAKVYKEPSRFGINKGRVSNITCFHDDKVIADYDRGWEMKPIRGTKNAKAFDYIIDELERRR